MLEHLGEGNGARRLMKAVEDVCAAGIMTPDMDVNANTQDVTDTVIAAIRESNLPPACCGSDIERVFFLPGREMSHEGIPFLYLQFEICGRKFVTQHCFQ